MRTILLLNIILFFTACGGSDTHPPDKNAVHVNPQITIDTDKPKHFYDIQTALDHVDSAKILILSGTKFEKFPIDICKLINLEELILTHCDLDSIPESISNLKHLKHLSLRSNQLKTLPKGLFTLTELETLDNFGNEINTLSPDVRNLTNLKELNVSFNNLKALPDLTGLNNLRNLGCDGNFLTAIPPSVCSLKKLSRLSFLRNKITTVNSCISELKYLNNFVLHENLLSDDEIAKVKALLPDRGVYADRQN